MARQIAPGTADYNSSLQMFRVMKTAERRMNDPTIGGSKRKKAAQRFKEFRKVLIARDYCVTTEPIVK